ncbi:pyruvate dehydrogenase E2 component (dihydrolipoamide acetyltransferase) [Thermocatellispora tengchongensis]|uniref:Dihydrolipoamide acetyltransferase component of pyruvate dehydrogenase complex n=1 Tax=Thermocatellispora tengchongensis TaxID=1073253 RepID=A0A840PL33_9ACTN|nr:dihydrolipoamide acetyltransferase family protein [Thermocatellispora tengchongensis]MBB5138663.1 pyruvate dehydrogenase E2 component (dihydrolipoamide acetyltransferase) [Thermocatellispora tengchongensis]
MRREFKLPDVGEGLTEAEIVRWHVKAGEHVTVNQTIVEIETAKAIVELPSPYEGEVAALLADEGQTVDVGTPIIAIEEGAPDAGPGRTSSVEDLVPSPPAEGAVEPGVHGSPAPKQAAPERQPVLVGYGVKLGAAKRRPRKAPQPSAPAPAPVVPSVPRQRGGVTVLAKPPVRKLAKDLGVDLATLTGTGPQGTITREDVHAAAAPRQAPPVEARPAPAGREERIPVKGVRKATAQAMVASAFTAPHVTEFLQVDVTATMDAVRRLRELPDFAEVKVSPLLLVARALLVAARRHPIVNSAWDEAAQEIVVRHYVNLGIAAATPRGLIVPNIKDAHTLTLPELAAALTTLAETARAGRTQPADMSGGTITITNVGVFGVDAGTPIINPGESAILAFGQVRQLPWVVDGQVVPREVTTLALSFDHRIIDGEQGSLFLRDVGAMLEDPLRMLAWS